LTKIKLAITIDLGDHFVKSTFRSKGDGLLVLECYEVTAAADLD